ncbi:MAG: zinc ribbon domain-containing protein [Chloroflexi bacterium]|nr:zinc ribbon domain-containing protein [Chloroflexota bacterium]
MIYCPQCSTANRDGSKFCNECGNDLQSAASARSGIAPPTLPEEAPEAEPAASLEAPSALPSAPPARDDETADREAAPEPSAGTPPLPDWLVQLREGASPEPVEGQVDMSETSPQPLSSQGEGRRGEEAHREQQREQAESLDTAPPAPAPETPLPALVSGDFPDWLKELKDAERAPVEAGLVPALARPPEAVEGNPPVEPLRAEAAPVDAPGWLKPVQPKAEPAPIAVTIAAAGVASDKPAVEKPISPPQAAQTPATGDLADTGLPPWLEAFRPGRPRPGSDAVETSGLLADIRGILPVESVLTLPHKSAPPKAKTAPARPASAFESLHTSPPPPPETPPAASASASAPTAGQAESPTGGPSAKPHRRSRLAVLVLMIPLAAALPFLPQLRDALSNNAPTAGAAETSFIALLIGGQP